MEHAPEAPQQGSETKETTTPEKKTLGQKIKNRIKSYFRNLNPRGKDKFWWAGNLLSATGTASLYIFAPIFRPLKTLLSASVSIGIYGTEKAMEKHRNNNWTEEQRAEYYAKRQEKFPNGVSRLKRFLLGVSAGGIYGAAIGIPLEIAHDPNAMNTIERHVDPAKR